MKQLDEFSMTPSVWMYTWFGPVPHGRVGRASGDLWFPSVRGAVKLDPRHLPERRSGPVLIESVSVAGTVFPSRAAAATQGVEGVEVLVTDANGKQLTLRSNGAGNFYTAESLADLVDIQVQNQTRRMRMDLSVVGGGSLRQVGSCNRCHLDAPSGLSPTLGQQGAPGRLFIPAP